MKRRMIAVLAAAVLALSFTACGGQQEASAVSSAPEESSEKVVGGWTLPEQIKGFVPDDAQKVFDSAMKDYKDGKLTAVDLLGTQVVAGMNYMFLCEAENPAGLKVAVVYADTEGNAQISSVSDFDLGAYSQAEDSGAGEKGLSGGWTVNEEQPDGSMPQECATAYSKAMEGMTGAEYTPALYLGSQVVSGMNYAVLSMQTLVTAEPVKNLSMVYIYAPASGDPEVMNIYTLDLAEFNQ